MEMNPQNHDLPDLNGIRSAAERIGPYIHRTPVLTCASLDHMADAQLFFKCENFQKVGAFKFRGACNAVFSLSEAEARSGVATHSSGNHAAALSLAARRRGIKAFIVMPHNAPKVKRAAVAGYGGQIVFCESTLKSREQTLDRVVEQTGARLVHPYNDSRVIEGQGTAALELLAEVPKLETVIAPVGGGGLMSGTAIAVSGISQAIRIIGVEPEAADDARRSLLEGRIVPSMDPRTIADGLRTSLGDLTFAIIRRLVHEVVTVSEEGIAAAMRTVWERMKIIIEPSSAVPLAAVLERKVKVSGKRIGIIISGGNVDLDSLPWAESRLGPSLCQAHLDSADHKRTG
jgi:threonine dehydratase